MIRELLSPKVLSPSVIEKIGQGHILFQRATRPETGNSYYGLGQYESMYRGVRTLSHGGAAHAAKAFMLRAPAQKVGCWVTCNDEEFGGLFLYVIAQRLLDNLLGLEPIDWDSRYIGPTLKGKVPAPIPEGRPPPEHVEGTYFNPGYGSFTIQKLTPSPLADTLADVLAKAGRTLDLDRPNYFVKLAKRSFINHLLLEHRDGPIFDWTATMLFKTLEDETEMVGSSFGTGKLVSTQAGFGMFGGWWDFPFPSTIALPVSEENVAEKSEAWFARVEITQSQ